ncbi:MAG: aminoacyl-tRNA hydrolase [Patescibacteria group bacterium]
MKLIIGLGNPGIKYEKTRHNLGWLVIDQLAQKIGINNWKNEVKFNSLLAQGNFNDQKIILAKPETFMNDSGSAVQAIANYYKIPSKEIIIIHDEIDLPLGEIKVQESRGAAGHKGVQSIINHLGINDFNRIRIGIKPEKNNIETEKFVMQKFTNEEEEVLKEIIERAAQITIATL